MHVCVSVYVRPFKNRIIFHMEYSVFSKRKTLTIGKEAWCSNPWCEKTFQLPVRLYHVFQNISSDCSSGIDKLAPKEPQSVPLTLAATEAQVTPPPSPSAFSFPPIRVAAFAKLVQYILLPFLISSQRVFRSYSL